MLQRQRSELGKVDQVEFTDSGKSQGLGSNQILTYSLLPVVFYLSFKVQMAIPYPSPLQVRRETAPLAFSPRLNPIIQIP